VLTLIISGHYSCIIANITCQSWTCFWKCDTSEVITNNGALIIWNQNANYNHLGLGTPTSGSEGIEWQENRAGHDWVSGLYQLRDFFKVFCNPRLLGNPLNHRFSQFIMVGRTDKGTSLQSCRQHANLSDRTSGEVTTSTSSTAQLTFPATGTTPTSPFDRINARDLSHIYKKTNLWFWKWHSRKRYQSSAPPTTLIEVNQADWRIQSDCKPTASTWIGMALVLTKTNIDESIYVWSLPATFSPGTGISTDPLASRER